MSTTALNGVYCPRGIQTPGILPRKPDTRTIIREEVRRQRELEKLEERYKAGEISKFEYIVNKVALNMPTQPPVVYYNNEYMA